MSFNRKHVIVAVVLLVLLGIGLGVWFVMSSQAEASRKALDSSEVAERPSRVGVGDEFGDDEASKSESVSEPVPGSDPVSDTTSTPTKTPTEEKVYDVGTRKVTLPHVDLGRDVSDEKIAQVVGDAMARENVPMLDAADIEVTPVRSEKVSDRNGKVDCLRWDYVMSQGDAVVVVKMTCRDFEDMHDVLSVDFATYAAEAPEVVEASPYAGARTDHGVHGVDITALPTPDGRWVVRCTGTLQGDWSKGADGLPTLSVNGHCVGAVLDRVGDGYANVSYTVVTDIDDDIEVGWAGGVGRAKVSAITDDHIDLVANLGLSADEAAQSAADGIANAVCSTRRTIDSLSSSARNGEL